MADVPLPDPFCRQNYFPESSIRSLVFNNPNDSVRYLFCFTKSPPAWNRWSGFYCWQLRTPSVTFPFPVFLTAWLITPFLLGFQSWNQLFQKKQRGRRIHFDGSIGSSNIQPPRMPSAVVPTPTSNDQGCQWQLSTLGLECDSSCISESCICCWFCCSCLFLWYLFPGSCSLAFPVILWFPNFLSS